MAFSESQWRDIFDLAESDGARFGFPERRDRSVLMGGFNTLKLGDASDGAKRWDFLQLLASRFDLLALQEVMDDLSGLNRLLDSLDGDVDVVVSDTTGAAPGDRGLRERLAFVFRPGRIARDELASDITYDRSRVTQKLFENFATWRDFFEDFERRVREAEETGRRRPSLSERTQPAFLTFIRTPHCAAFRILGRQGAAPIPFLATNAHMLFGNARSERRREFLALLEWLFERSKVDGRRFHPNMILLGDLNFDFDRGRERNLIEDSLRQLNNNQLSARDASRVNFPFAFVHPGRPGPFRTNARGDETFDHIAFFVDPDEPRLPRTTDNARAGQSLDGFDYGVIDFVELFAEALHGADFNSLTGSQQDALFESCEDQVSDHMPIWTRLPIPGA
jgi:hypothetical protein